MANDALYDTLKTGCPVPCHGLFKDITASTSQQVDEILRLSEAGARCRKATLFVTCRDFSSVEHAELRASEEAKT